MAKGFVAKLLLFFLVLTFAVWGIGDIFRSASEQAVATVNGESVYVSELDNTIKTLQSRYPQITAEVAADPYFRIEALNTLINNRLSEAEADALGISFSRDTMAGYIARDTSFQRADGSFNRDTFQMVLSQNGMTEARYLAMLNDDLSSALIQDTVAMGVQPSNEMISLYYAIAEEEREATLLLFGKKDIGTVPAATKEELEKLYSELAPSLRDPEYRTVRYLTLNADTVWKQLNLEPDETIIQTMYDERKDGLKQPATREVSQLLFLTEQPAKDAYAALQKGEDFKTVAGRTDVINKGQSEPSKVSIGDLPAESADAVFALAPQSFSEPVQTGFGWLIYYVHSAQDERQLSFDDAREMLFAEYKAEKTEEALNDLVNRFEDDMAAGKTMEQALKDGGLSDVKIESIGPIAADGTTPKGTNVPLTPLQREVLESTMSLQEHESTPLTYSEEGTYFLAQVSELIASNLRPMADFTTKLQGIHKERKEQEAIKAAAQKAADFIATVETPQATALEAGYSLHQSGRLKRIHDTITNNSQLKDKILTSGFVLELFKLKKNQTTQPYPLPNGEYVVGIVNHIHPAPEPSSGQLEALRTSIGKDMASELLEQYYRYLRIKYDVDIKTDVIFGEEAAPEDSGAIGESPAEAAANEPASGESEAAEPAAGEPAADQPATEQ